MSAAAAAAGTFACGIGPPTTGMAPWRSFKTLENCSELSRCIFSLSRRISSTALCISVCCRVAREISTLTVCADLAVDVAALVSSPICSVRSACEACMACTTDSRPSAPPLPPPLPAFDSELSAVAILVSDA
jgi:hypothetical protein